MAVNAHLQRSPLRDIAVKVEKGVRLSDGDALQLYETCDLHTLAILADHAKQRLFGDRVYYNLNRHIDYSNLCSAGCSFCSYSRRAGQEGVFDLTLDDIEVKAREAADAGATELHIVGGLHPFHPFDWYEEMLRRLKASVPAMHLKCFTAVEILHLSRLSGLPCESVLSRLKQAGLDSLPGGGAEIFHEDVRRRICPDKANAAEWGEVHRAAHRMGMKTNATMLYGHIETTAHRVDHMRRLREWQDETGGFAAFVPLAYHRGREGLPERTAWGGVVQTSGTPSSQGKCADSSLESARPEIQVADLRSATGARPLFIPEKASSPSSPICGGVEDLKNFAVARLYLDNIPHIKAYWVMLGLPLTQVALSYGVDDVDGTVMEEHIYHMTGADTPDHLSAGDLRELVRGAGREPIERDSLYREVGKARA